MARQKSQLGRATSNAKRMKLKRSMEDDDQRQNRLLKARLRKSKKLKGSDVMIQTKDVDDKQLNGEKSCNEEVTVQENLHEEGSNKKARSKRSKQNNGKPDVNDVRSKIIGGAGSEDKTCSFRSENKIELFKINQEPSDYTLEEEEK